QRRNAFRAELRRAMIVTILLRNDQNETASGTLRDLSMTGCSVDMEPDAEALLDDKQRTFRLVMTFPNLTEFSVLVRVRHFKAADHTIRCGFQFDDNMAQQQEMLWYLVCETEREAARSVMSGNQSLRRSPLFQEAQDRERRKS